MSNEDDSADLVEATSSAVAGAIGNAIAGPVGAAIATVGADLVNHQMRHSVKQSVRRRAEFFEFELLQAMRDGIPASAFNEEEFQDVIYQAFWRAMDTLNPDGIRGLARLTALYYARSPTPSSDGPVGCSRISRKMISMCCERCLQGSRARRSRKCRSFW